jgi:hypothetical protein
MENKLKKNGYKMIWLNVGFWTNNLRGESENIFPKHAWSSGYVYLESNKLHGIKPASAHFYSPSQWSVAIEKTLIKAGIKLHLGRVPRKYMVIEGK